MTPAALDPGSARCGLAARPDGGAILAHCINVNGDTYAAAAAIVDWLVSVGATSLVIEWGRWFPVASRGGNMATFSNWLFQRKIVLLVCGGCAAVGIVTATVEAAEAIGMPPPEEGAPKRERSPYIILAPTWRSRIGVVADKILVNDPHTGCDVKKRVGTWDRYVYAALVRHLGADVVSSVLTSVDRRDAAGALLGWQIGAPGKVRTSSGTVSANRSAGAVARGVRQREERAAALAAGWRPPINAATQRAIDALEKAGVPMREKTITARASVSGTNLQDAVRYGYLVQPARGEYWLPDRYNPLE